VDWSCFETRRTLHEIIEGSQQLEGEEFNFSYLANGNGYVALKRAAEDREGWKHREMMSKAYCTAEDY